MYTRHIKALSLATDSGSPNMSISVMTSISEQDEHGVRLDDADCPHYDTVVNRLVSFPWPFTDCSYLLKSFERPLSKLPRWFYEFHRFLT